MVYHAYLAEGLIDIMVVNAKFKLRSMTHIRQGLKDHI